MSKLVGRTWYTCDEFQDGEVKIVRNHLDLQQSKVIPQTVLEFENGRADLYTPDEMIMAAVAGRVAAHIYQEYPIL
jgi:hypothetical protein